VTHVWHQKYFFLSDFDEESWDLSLQAWGRLNHVTNALWCGDLCYNIPPKENITIGCYGMEWYNYY
jgi:hypothetical protein